MNIYSEPLFGVNVGFGMMMTMMMMMMIMMKMIKIMMVMMSCCEGKIGENYSDYSICFSFGGGEWKDLGGFGEWCRNSVATQSGPSFLSLEKLTVSFAAMKGHHHM